MRGFQAYEPRRYHWVAAWSRLLGDGLLGVRRAGVLFQEYMSTNATNFCGD